MASSNSTAPTKRSRKAPAAPAPESARLPVDDRTYTQAEVYETVGQLQAEVGTMLATIYQLSQAARIQGDASAKAQAIYVAERFARDAYLQIDDALDAVGCGRMGYFDDEAVVTEGAQA